MFGVGFCKIKVNTKFDDTIDGSTLDSLIEDEINYDDKKDIINNVLKETFINIGIKPISSGGEFSIAIDGYSGSAWFGYI